MASRRITLEPGSLWPALLRQSSHALQVGALQSIATRTEFISDAGVQFMVRIASALALKDAARHRQAGARSEGKPLNPFLPYDEHMFVAPHSASHVALLNKYNVVEHHLLMVTRQFEHQQCPLTLDDFIAMWACLADFEGLAFYNGGEIAGASQPHKHLQMVPLPLASQGPAIPIDPLLDDAEPTGEPGELKVLPGYPFLHRLVVRGYPWNSAPLRAAKQSQQDYRAMLEALGLNTAVGVDGSASLPPYNLLATRRWLLVLPRRTEYFGSVSVNALGFVGSLFVRDGYQLEQLKEVGPMTVLRQVAGRIGE